MTFLTSKMQILLNLISSGFGEKGIYALAQRANRPYRRVYSQVQRLAAAGFVTLTRYQVRGRSIVRVRSVRCSRPALSFNRAWSRPDGQIGVDTQIAGVLKQPTFNDLLACVQHYGLPRVRNVYRDMLNDLDLPEGAAVDAANMLNNIEIGYGRAAKKNA